MSPNRESSSRTDAPRTFREVGIMMAELRDDNQDIKRTQDKIIARMDRFVHIVTVSLLCPIIVAVVVAVLMKNAR